MTDPLSRPNGWGTYEKLVLNKLDVLDVRMSSLDQRLTTIRENEIGQLKVEIAMLKVKSGLWGAAAGLFPVLLFVGYEILKGA